MRTGECRMRAGRQRALYGPYDLPIVLKRGPAPELRAAGPSARGKGRIMADRILARLLTAFFCCAIVALGVVTTPPTDPHELIGDLPPMTVGYAQASTSVEDYLAPASR